MEFADDGVGHETPHTAVQQFCNDHESQSERLYNADNFFPSGLPEMDPFSMFDPQFDLDAIDAFLEGNLDIAAPITFR